VTPLSSRIENDSQRPAGSTTSPPPAAWATAIAALIASVSRVAPSPTRPELPDVERRAGHA
jgi:hypothetical protein